jgi:hypothetical protein
MTDESKRTLSMIVFSLAGLCGLWGCAALPMAIFTIGVNDSVPEVWALLLPATLLPTCIIALWWRRQASVWLLLLGMIWIYGMTWQRHYMETIRHFPQESLWAFFLGAFMPAYLILGLGIFGLYGELHQWPRIIGRRRAKL